MKKKIYILHGWTYNLGKYVPFIAALRFYGIEAELIKIPGLTAPMKAPMDLDDYARWLSKILSKDRGKVMLLGHSNGGRIAIRFCLKYPGKVSKLFLLDSAGVVHNDIFIQMKRAAFKVASALGKKFTTSSKISRWVYKLAREHDYEKASPVLRKTMHNLITTDLTPDLHELKVKTVLIWGEKDTLTPISDANIMRREIPDVSFHFIPNAGHSPHYTYPEKVAAIIQKEI